MTHFRSYYRDVFSMEPLVPVTSKIELADLNVEILRKSGELKSALPSEILRKEIAGLVRVMNSYYTSLIEGQSTLPEKIQSALAGNFSQNEDEEHGEALCVAHIQAEEAMRNALSENPGTRVFSKQFTAHLHELFYSALPAEKRFVINKAGRKLPIKPGSIRDYNITEGRHIPPSYSSISAFLNRFEEKYSDPQLLSTEKLVNLAAAHHRLTWIHPFAQGNGQVTRLQSQAALIAAGVDSDGLWSLSRGFAHTRPAYSQNLQRADQKRSNSSDGQGNLSDEGLADFCRYFLEQCIEQIDFMVDLVKPFNLQERIENYLRFIRVDLDAKLREHLVRLLKALCLEGEIARGAVPQLLNLKGTASRDVIRKATREGLITSLSEKRPLRLAFPEKVLDSYFPRLFMDLPV